MVGKQLQRQIKRETKRRGNKRVRGAVRQRLHIDPEADLPDIDYGKDNSEKFNGLDDPSLARRRRLEG
jgi:hypothetical protein